MKRMRYYCTFFNEFYIPKFLALLQSMEQHCGNFVLYCGCMDDEAYSLVVAQNKEHLIPFRWADYEARDSELAAAKKNRSLVEYFFTCTASVCHYMLKQVPEGELLNYLDADTYFFSEPEPIFEEIGKKSIGIIEHRWWGLAKIYKKYGLFNVGWISLRNNDAGRRCAEHWRTQCLNWCYDKLEHGKFADQKYLDEWPHKYSEDLCTISHIGANAAPWNVGQYRLTQTGSKLYLNHSPLIFFHFASFKKDGKGRYISRTGTYFTPMRGLLRTAIYEPYVRLLEKNTQVNNNSSLKRGAHTMSLKGTLKLLFFHIRTFIYNDNIRV